VSDDKRIEELRRRVQRDPASIAFAQLAEEYRRVGRLQEAIDVCLTGLGIHPGYVSARVTLARALMGLDRLEEARSEFEVVLKRAPENLAAVRGLSEIHRKRGDAADAMPTSDLHATGRTVAALERFLSAIHVARAERRA